MSHEVRIIHGEEFVHEEEHIREEIRPEMREETICHEETLELEEHHRWSIPDSPAPELRVPSPNFYFYTDLGPQDCQSAQMEFGSEEGGDVADGGKKLFNDTRFPVLLPLYGQQGQEATYSTLDLSKSRPASAQFFTPSPNSSESSSNGDATNRTSKQLPMQPTYATPLPTEEVSNARQKSGGGGNKVAPVGSEGARKVPPPASPHKADTPKPSANAKLSGPQKALLLFGATLLFLLFSTIIVLLINYVFLPSNRMY